MDRLRIALIGFGNVGQGFVQLLRDKEELFAEQFGVRFSLVAVCDSIKGSVYHTDGLSPAELLCAVHQYGDLASVAASAYGWDAYQTIASSDADVIVELSPTNLTNGEPAYSYLCSAIRRGKHVVTTNKGPIALYYPELRALAAEYKVELGIEGTVMSGTPGLILGQKLMGVGIQRIQGIVNGTTNYILTQMASGISYADALREAQMHGYAEADPTGDVEGYDAAGKIVIMTNLLMDTPLKLSDVTRKGIAHLTREDITAASEQGQVWKMLGCIEKCHEGVVARVGPVLLPLTHPLASITGVTNAITFTTDALGDITIIGPGAGRLETGAAVLTDLLTICEKRKR